MKAELGGARVTLAQLLTTEKGIASLATYLQKTKVAIRKWQLGQIDESERFLGGWGDLA